VSFAVPADAYDRFMGRYSVPLAPQLADFAEVSAGQQVLDVGCGPGALTAVLVERVGVDSVKAVDPSEPFVDAARERHPGVDIRRASAEQLPFGEDMFDAALAQLVVHFMTDPAAGLREMARVTRQDGVVAACVWDHAGGGGQLSTFWEAAHELEAGVGDESQLAGVREGHLGQLLREAGLNDVEETTLVAEVEHPSFEEWWEPFALGVGPAGAFVAGLDPLAQDRLRDRCRALQPEPPFTVSARPISPATWSAHARTSGRRSSQRSSSSPR
jgi:SAM-dependent methyltransferase